MGMISMRIRWALALLLPMVVAEPLGAEPVEIPLADGTMLKADLFMPTGEIRAPAIVALYGCGGPYPKRDAQWRDLLVGQGYIMLFPNSFSSRGLGPQCRERDRKVTSFVVRRDDAIASARWLAARAGTPPGGVAVMGWSDGASTVVAVAPVVPVGLVRGLVAFYPGCYVATRDPAWKPVAPLLVLMGAVDDWTPAAPCRAVADRSPPGVMEMIAYPGAYHDFDVPGGIRAMKNIPSSQNPDKSVHAGTDPAGREDALKRVPAFLEAIAK